MSSTKSKNHPDWAFSLSTLFAGSDDDSHSDSEEPDNQTLATGLPIDDDLDLSKREEHVPYKPNPFSIAKINAAYRPTSTVNSSLTSLPAEPVRPTHKPTQTQKPTKRSCPDPRQTTITEGFKAQAMKKSTTNALQLSDFSSVPSRLPEYAHILSPEVSQSHDAQTLPTIPQSHASSSAQLLPDTLHIPTDTHGPVFPSHSSPARPHNDESFNSRALYSQTYSSPVQPVRESLFRPYSQPFLRHTTTKSFVPPFLKPFDTKRVSFREPSSPTIQINDYSEDLKLDGNIKAKSPEFPRNAPAFPAASNVWHSPKSLNQPLHIEGRQAGLSQSPSLISSSSPNPSTRTRIPDDSSSIFTQVKSHRKCDAYQYPIDDSDEEWATLPSRKKRKRKLKTVISRNSMYTQSFLIPGLRVPPAVKAETNATSTSRRQQVYLPPPPSSVDVRCPRTNKNSKYSENGPSVEATKDRYSTPSSPASSDVNAYPSPNASSPKFSIVLFSPANKTQNSTPSQSRRQVRAMAPYRPPSPPTSDLPIPSDDARDIHLEVDPKGIECRYPELKRLSRKRRRANAEVWNLLGVDSCGRVWKDDRRQDEQAEIQIVMWSPTSSVRTKE